MAFVKVCWSVFIPFHLERKICMHMMRFPKNDIISLVGEAPRYDLGESVGPDLRLAELLDVPGQASLGEMRSATRRPQATLSSARRLQMRTE